MGERKRLGLLRWAGTLVVVVPLGVLVSGCGDSDNDDATEGTGGTAGTGPTGDTGGTGGTETQECKDFHAAPTVVAACRLILPDCPATLEEFLTYERGLGVSNLFSVVEAEGLREVRATGERGGRAFSFDEDGMLAGWIVWNDGPSGWCGMHVYQRGRLLGGFTEPADLRRCDLAPDALETGILCACPCPEPPPENAIYGVTEACLSPNKSWPRCLPTFADQRSLAASRGAPMRTGCGVRTITFDELDCAYDDVGMLLGGERHRGDEPRDECPGVDTYRTGALPVDCADETTCYFGAMPPAGSTPCPSEG